MRSSTPAQSCSPQFASTSTLTLAQLIQVLILLKQLPANQDFVMPPPRQAPNPSVKPSFVQPPVHQRRLLGASPAMHRGPQSFQAQVHAILQSENYQRAERKTRRELLGTTLYSHVATLTTP